MAMRLRAALIAALSLAIAFAAFAHGGGTDSQGGHNDRKRGGYHFHRGPLAGKSFSSKSAATAALRAARSSSAKSSRAVASSSSGTKSLEERHEALLRLMIRKGVITEKEWADELARK